MRRPSTRPRASTQLSGLGQRYAHQVAAAFARATGERDLRAERGEVARAVIHHLRGQVLGLLASRGA